MSTRASALYEGWVRHERTADVDHAFRVRLSLLYLDCGEIDELFGRGPITSSRGPSLLWFRRSDYLGDPRMPLADAVRDLVLERTGRRPTGPVRMLTQTRTFGYVLNPVTFYYCFDPSGERLTHFVAHITNTPWGERFAYVLRCDERKAVRARFRKAFHVSPFLGMDMDYSWFALTPAERLVVHMENDRSGDRQFRATLALRRRPLTRGRLAMQLLRAPLQTFRVTAGIYWNALRLWAKRARFHPHPVLRSEATRS